MGSMVAVCAVAYTRLRAHSARIKRGLAIVLAFLFLRVESQRAKSVNATSGPVIILWSLHSQRATVKQPHARLDYQGYSCRERRVPTLTRGYTLVIAESSESTRWKYHEVVLQYHSRLRPLKHRPNTASDALGLLGATQPSKARNKVMQPYGKAAWS